MTIEKIDELINRFQFKADYYFSVAFPILEEDYRNAVEALREYEALLKENARQPIIEEEVETEETIIEDRADTKEEEPNEA